jgi:hypothetical protein
MHRDPGAALDEAPKLGRRAGAADGSAVGAGLFPNPRCCGNRLGRRRGAADRLDRRSALLDRRSALVVPVPGRPNRLCDSRFIRGLDRSGTDRSGLDRSGSRCGGGCLSDRVRRRRSIARRRRSIARRRRSIERSHRSIERSHRSMTGRAATACGVRSVRSAVTAIAMAAAHRVRAASAANADSRWATDRGEGSPRVVADMRIQVGSGAVELGRTGVGILPPAPVGRPCQAAAPSGGRPARRPRSPPGGRPPRWPGVCALGMASRGGTIRGDAHRGIPPEHPRIGAAGRWDHPDPMPHWASQGSVPARSRAGWPPLMPGGA